MATINSRIKEVRKEAGLNQKEFSEVLGLTQSGVSYMEQDGRNVSDTVLKGICAHFNVCEIWLRTGSGDMHTKPPSFSLDRFATEHGASDLELEILKAYFELDPEIRRTVLDHFVNRISGTCPTTTPMHDRTSSTSSLEDEYKKRVLGSASNPAACALSTTGADDVPDLKKA